MKGILLGVGLLVPWVFAASAVRADDPLVLKVNREVAITATGLDMDYHEFQSVIHDPALIDTGVYADSRTGWSPGVNLTWSDVFESRHGRPSFYVRTEYQYYDWTIAHHNYSTAGVRSSITDESPIKINDFSTELGIAAVINDGELLAGFFQVEYLDWQRVLATSPRDYKEDYSFAAPGAGVRDTIALSKRLALSGKLGFEYTSWVQVAGSGDPKTHVPPLTFRLGSHFLGQGSVGLDYAVSPSVALKLGVDFSHFAFGHSQVIKTIFEPDSVTNETVTQAGIGWTY